MRKCFLVSVLCSMGFFLFGCILGRFSEITLEPKKTVVDFFKIIFHNGQVSLGILLGGVITFSIFSIAIMFFNATTAGFLVVKLLQDSSNHQFLEIFAPHASVEILAYTIFLSISFYITKALIFSLKHKKETHKWISPLIKRTVLGITFFSGWITLFIAAIIEAFAY